MKDTTNVMLIGNAANMMLTGRGNTTNVMLIGNATNMMLTLSTATRQEGGPNARSSHDDQNEYRSSNAERHANQIFSDVVIGILYISFFVAENASWSNFFAHLLTSRCIFSHFAPAMRSRNKKHAHMGTFHIEKHVTFGSRGLCFENHIVQSPLKERGR